MRVFATQFKRLLTGGTYMHKSEAVTKKDQIQQGSNNKFSEVNEFNHENNHVAKAQKQISSQETAGVFDQQ